VAVVLSAQATDAGVNKATRALFAQVDTPEKMVALGEAKLRDAIKTIGLFNTKARNVIALSHKLIAEHGGCSRPLCSHLPQIGIHQNVPKSPVPRDRPAVAGSPPSTNTKGHCGMNSLRFPQ
jgi:endonuclease III